MPGMHGKSAAIWFGTTGTGDPTELTGYLKEYSGSAKIDTAETSTFGSSQKTYVQGLSDSTLSCSGLYDGTAAAVDSIFAAAVGAATDAGVIISPSGTFVNGTRVLAGQVIETSYQVSGSIGDAVSVSAEFQSDTGFRSGVALIGTTGGDPLGIASPGGDGTSVLDMGTNFTTSANGLLGILMVTANTIATSSIVTVKSSANDSAYTTHLTFPTLSSGVKGTYVQVLAPGTTINKYLRHTTALTGAGTFTAILAVVRL